MDMRSLREAAGKTQRECAMALGVGERTYVRWEHGDAVPSGGSLVRLADFLGVHPRELLISEGPATEDAGEVPAEESVTR